MGNVAHPWKSKHTWVLSPPSVWALASFRDLDCAPGERDLVTVGHTARLLRGVTMTMRLQFDYVMVIVGPNGAAKEILTTIDLRGGNVT